MKTKINTLIFDCFGVVFDPVFLNWYKDNMLSNGLMDENLLNMFKEHDLGKTTEEDVANYFSKYEGINSTKEKIIQDFDNYLNLNKELVGFIIKLKKKGFKIALLSNGNHNYFEDKLYKKYPEFKNLFDQIIISSEVGVVKPDKEIYLHALEKINSKPEETLFIDDSQVNIDGSEKLGIKGYLYKNNEDFIKYIKNMGINL